MEERPTLPELYDLQCGSRSIDIIEKIGTKYFKFGSILLLDDEGDKMSVIVKEYRDNAADINREVLCRWIKGEGKKTITWATLVTVLDRCGLTELAETIRTKR